MKLTKKQIIAFLLGFAVIIGVMYLLYGDSKNLITGDLMNNQAELETLAKDLLDGDLQEQGLYDKYSMTYDIEADVELGVVEFVAVDTTIGFCYTEKGQPIVSGSVEKIAENWYYFEG